MTDAATTTLLLQFIQLAITGVAVTVDLFIVVRLVWIPLIRSMPKEDRPYLWASVATYAREARKAAETQARLDEQKRRKEHGG